MKPKPNAKRADVPHVDCGTCPDCGAPCFVVSIRNQPDKVFCRACMKRRGEL
jgi:hypothetical protein